MEPWRQPLQSPVDSCNRIARNVAEQHNDVANRYFALEIQYGTQVPPIDLRSQLPVTVVRAVVAGCSSDRISVADSKSRWGLRKACDEWNIPASTCLFLLDASSHRRPFFKPLLILAKLCPNFQDAVSALRTAAEMRRQRPQTRKGIARNACSLVKDDIIAVINDYSNLEMISGPRRPRESLQERQATPDYASDDSIEVARRQQALPSHVFSSL
ncbi:hypothetical protein ColTof4_09382 [Colletotrichum tofieldiae]|nr:hypothetical protein ColTof3_12670 [Colletotrichum tofieldiae]GKT76959.1 hypothetical protein ColTof4_09382 [Colletotrichum tofieldiae]